MSARPKPTAEVNPAAEIEAGAADVQLGEGNSYCVASPDNPLRRNLVVSIRASLNSLCLQKSKGTWSPSSDALKSILQQKKFTSLDGAADPQGDLKAHDHTIPPFAQPLLPPLHKLDTRFACAVGCAPRHASRARRLDLPRL